MSDWCEEHKKYEGKRQPNTLCGKCWLIFFYRNPEQRGPEQAERRKVGT